MRRQFRRRSMARPTEGREMLDRRITKLAITITVIEVVVLVVWLALTRMAVAPQVAAGFLFAGILLEELLRFRGIKGHLPFGRGLALLVLGVGIETATWIAALSAGSVAGLLVVLFVGLVVEHAIIAAATGGGSISLRGALDFSAVEAAGGAIWLADPSAATIVILVTTSVLEHVQGIRQGYGLRA